MGQATESDCSFRVRTREERVDIQHFNERLDYPNSKRAVRDQAKRIRPSNVLIENKASGIQLIQELVRESIYGVTRYEPKADKIMRLHSATNMCT